MSAMVEVDPMGVTAVRKLLGSETQRACVPGRRSVAGRRRGWVGAAVAAAMLVLAPDVSRSGVLSESDFKKVEMIKPLFQGLMMDLVQTSKRSDISSGDADCVMSTIRELLQISEELSSYEYLITIEKEITDSGDSGPIKGVVKFAIEKSNTILLEERKRWVQFSIRK